MKKYLPIVAALVSVVWSAPGQTTSLYQNDFEKSEIGKAPDDFIIFEGAFAVRDIEGNKVLELPGAPLGEGSGLIFGPTEKEDVAVSLRISGTGKGRRYPTMAVGLNGQGTSSYRLQVTPAKKAVELFKGEVVAASVPFEWRSGTWTRFRLQIRKVKDGEWAVEGKAWPQTAPEPQKWQVTYTEKKEPVAGRASLWGNPYAGTPILFDDLSVTRASANP